MKKRSLQELPDTYVIFVCDFDPFGLRKYRYTQKKICEEQPGFEIDDGAHTIFLSTKGENEAEVPKELVNFLKYVSAPLEQSEADFDDDYVRKLQKAVKEIKQSREMGARYMSFEEHMRDQWKAGRAEGRAEGEAKAKREMISNALKRGNSAEAVADFMGVPLEEVQEIESQLEN